MAQRPADPLHASRLREPGEGTRHVAPLIDVYETDEAFVVVADMPGVRPDGLEVVAERETLTIRGRVIRPQVPPEHQEYELADYFQSLALTEDLDSSAVSATLKDGVLRVTIPKSPTVRPKRIQVKVE
jgi:HSP20 family molecular chaperone IbpA